MMSVDLEDFYCDLPFDQWSKYQGRVIQNTKVILKLFEKHNITATFFTLGYIAEKALERLNDFQHNKVDIVLICNYLNYNESGN